MGKYTSPSISGNPSFGLPIVKALDGPWYEPRRRDEFHAKDYSMSFAVQREREKCGDILQLTLSVPPKLLLISFVDLI